MANNNLKMQLTKVTGNIGEEPSPYGWRGANTSSCVCLPMCHTDPSFKGHLHRHSCYLLLDPLTAKIGSLISHRATRPEPEMESHDTVVCAHVCVLPL